MEEHSGVRHVPLREAARLLGISKDAVRQRIRRGTLRSTKGEDGRVYVYLDVSSDAVHYDHDQEHDQRSHRSRMPYEGSPAELVDELRDRIRYLERQVEIRTDELREERRIIAALTSRIPELPAPASTEQPAKEPVSFRVGKEREDATEETRAPQSVWESLREEPERAEPRSSTPGAQEATERPWWRRMFGG